MPRNAQGQYFLPDGNPVVAGELVKAEWANSTLDDVANALTNSLDRAGAGGMTGQLKAVAGTVLRPGVSFVEDPATGIYKESQGVMGLSASGIKQAYVTQNGLFVSSAPSEKMEVANKGYVDSLASQATEIILSFGVSKTPADLPTNGYIPVNWDATGSPFYAVQFSQGQSAVYRPANTADPLYNHVYVYVSTNTIAAGWIDIGTVAGPPGPQGEIGPIGPIGPQGPVGEQGPTGQTGPLGPVGPTGPQGPTGAQGAKGDTGPAGQSIKIVGAFGVSKTPADLPSNGFIPANWDSPGNPANDIQLAPSQCLIYTDVPQSDPLYGHLYEYVGTGTGFDANGWIDLGDIQGPAGSTGPQGPQGIQGATGPQGPAGTDGATGQQGPQGNPGAKGDTGDPGPTGPQGVKGDTGATGPKGDTGPQGPIGPSGGVSSVNGYTGAVSINYNSVGAPSSTGVNASGTWPISVTGSSASCTGNAATATTATTATTASNANSLGGVAASGYAQKAAANTFTGAQAANVSSFDVAAWIASGGGKTAYLTPTTLQLRENGVGVLAYSQGAIQCLPVTGGAGNATWTTGGLQQSANGFKPGGGPWADSSDVRLKTNIQTLDTCLEVVMALNPVQYNWVSGYRNGAPQVGFIADEVQQVMPSWVEEVTPVVIKDGEGNRVPQLFDDVIDTLGEGVSVKCLSFKNDVFAYLVGSIQDLNDQLQSAKADLSSLQGVVLTMQQQLDAQVNK